MGMMGMGMVMGMSSEKKRKKCQDACKAEKKAW